MNKLRILLAFASFILSANAQNNLYHFVDTKGTILKSFYSKGFENISRYEGGNIVMEENGLTAIVNGRKEALQNLNYKLVSYQGPGYFSFRQNNKYGLLDVNGKEIFAAEYDEIAAESEGLICFVKNDKMGFMDKTGKIIIASSYDYNFTNWSSFKNGLAMVKLNKKYGYINKQGKVIIPINLDLAEPFYDGLALVKKEGQMVYMNTKGQLIIKPNYPILYEFNDGVAFVGNDDKSCGFIDKTGKVVVPLIYDRLSYGKFSEGLAALQRKNKWGYINKQGQEVIPFKFDRASSFINGIARVNDCTYINKKGAIVFEKENCSGSDFYNGVALINDFNKVADISKVIDINKTAAEIIAKNAEKNRYTYLEEDILGYINNDCLNGFKNLKGNKTGKNKEQQNLYYAITTFTHTKARIIEVGNNDYNLVLINNKDEKIMQVIKNVFTKLEKDKRFNNPSKNFELPRILIDTDSNLYAKFDMDETSILMTFYTVTK